MSTKQKNRLKAIFLLVVFSMNTLAGFACSIGVDMGYNNHHHKKDNHHHKTGKAHSHNKSTLHHQHVHKQLSPSVSFNDTKDDCCSNTVTRFNLLDKSVTDHSLQWQTGFSPIVYLSAFFLKTENPATQNVKSRFQFVRRSCSLDDTDIRIAIQSFQI